jgi:hypothetical protein
MSREMSRRGDHSRTTIGVFPAGAQAARARLLGALEQTLPVRFEGRADGDWHGLGAAVCFGGEADPAMPVPALVALDAAARGGNGRVELADAARLDRRLRGAVLAEDGVGSAAPLAPGSGQEVLAATAAGPVWVAGERGARVAVAPDELGADEALRERLRPGRFLALLALVHFLREVSASNAWTPPPLRAAFVVDDPNLHWPSYGFLRYRELVAHADAHGYHVALATVPLDGWFAHPAAARLLRERPDRLSLLVHGNDHVHWELGVQRSERQTLELLAQAQRRVAGLERRAGVAVDRVMAPPHGRCSDGSLRGLVRTGFDALCRRPPHPGVDRVLAAWEPADVHTAGLPIVPRARFGRDRNELALDAFLDRPLVLYGHHGDFAGGLDLFAESAAAVNRLGDVEWTSLGQIAGTGALTRRAGRRLEIRLYARRVAIVVPEGVDELAVELAAGHQEPGRETVVAGATRASLAGRAAVMSARPGAVELALVRDDAVDPRVLASPRPHLRPLVRRLVTEGRDRVQPLAPRRARR